MALDASNVFLRCLGTGLGFSHCYDGVCSPGYVLEVHGEPALLIGCGGGVIAACRKHYHGTIPRAIFVPNNRTPWASDLPIVVSYEAAQQRRMTVFTGDGVARRIQACRLAELHEHMKATNRTVDDVADFVILQQGQKSIPVPGFPEISVTVRRAMQSECSYALLVLLNGTPLLAIGCDAMVDAEFLRDLSFAPHAVFDARPNGTSDHPSFEKLAAALPQAVAAAGRRLQQVYVGQHGMQEPSAEGGDPFRGTELVGCRIRLLIPGERVPLSSEPVPVPTGLNRDSTVSSTTVDAPFFPTQQQLPQDVVKDVPPSVERQVPRSGVAVVRPVSLSRESSPYRHESPFEGIARNTMLLADQQGAPERASPTSMARSVWAKHRSQIMEEDLAPTPRVASPVSPFREQTSPVGTTARQRAPALSIASRRSPSTTVALKLWLYSNEDRRAPPKLIMGQHLRTLAQLHDKASTALHLRPLERVYHADGRVVKTIAELQNGESLVCTMIGGSPFQGYNLQQMVQTELQTVSKHGSPRRPQEQQQVAPRLGKQFPIPSTVMQQLEWSRSGDDQPARPPSLGRPPQRRLSI